jgi:hypothetical protein
MEKERFKHIRSLTEATLKGLNYCITQDISYQTQSVPALTD